MRAGLALLAAAAATPLSQESSCKSGNKVEARLRLLVRTGDPAGTVTLRWLAGLLGEPVAGETASNDHPSGDLTIYEVAEHFRRAPSTIRGWLYQRDLRGYKLNGRAWRIPKSAVAEYEQRQRGAVFEDIADVDISAWRRI
jgi:excisionase family DNA binding protein